MFDCSLPLAATEHALSLEDSAYHGSFRAAPS
jgi:hypothetical protein